MHSGLVVGAYLNPGPGASVSLNRLVPDLNAEPGLPAGLYGGNNGLKKEGEIKIYT